MLPLTTPPPGPNLPRPILPSRRAPATAALGPALTRFPARRALGRCLRPALALAAFGSLCSALWGQGSTNTFQVRILPPANTLMVTQTVNAVFLTIANLNLFTNVAVTMTLSSTSTPMLDDGAPPDAAPADATYSADLLVPALPVPTNFVVRFTVVGDDLSVTNASGQLDPTATLTNSFTTTYLTAGRPANDHFTNAFKLNPAGGPVTGNNRLATIEPAEPFHGANPAVAASVWWTWSPTNNTRVLMDTAGSSFQPVLAVYTGSTLATLKQVAASTNDVPNNLKANVLFDALAGVTYRIAVAGYDSSGMGDINLRIIPGGVPDTEPPLVIVITPASQSLVTTNLITFTGTAKDLGPYPTGVEQVTIQLNDDPPTPVGGTAAWTATLDLPIGTNVVRAVARDVAGNVSRPFIVVLRYVSPLNDHFAEAIELVDLAGTASTHNGRATKEPGEPFHAGNEGGHSVWYWFLAPASGTLRLTTANSTFDTLLAVYLGDNLTNLVLVAANDDAAPGSRYSELTVALARAQLVRVAVDGFGGETGTLQLGHTFTTTEILYSLTILPALGGTVTPPSGLFPEGSNVTVTAVPTRDFRFTGWQGSATTAQNPLFLVMTQNYTLQASFLVSAYTDGYETGGLAPKLKYGSAGTAPWYVQSDVVYAGRYALRSGVIGNDGVSVLTLDVNLVAGTAAFEVRVSSEEGWDILEFHLDGVLQKHWTGEVNWQKYQFAVDAGRHQLQWRYVKDANFSRGLDAAFLDNLYLPLTDQDLAPTLSIGLPVPDQPQLLLQGYPGRSYVIQSSTNLLTWTARYTNSTPEGSWVWTDASAATLPVRLYRALLR